MHKQDLTKMVELHKGSSHLQALIMHLLAICLQPTETRPLSCTKMYSTRT